MLCWLEGDSWGDDTRTVEQAFAGIAGVELVRSHRDIKASGAADQWRPDMQAGAREVLDDWNADLAIAGRVNRSGDVLSLWMVPRSGDGTLERGNRPYRLESVTLGPDFHQDLQTQLTAMALAAVIPLVNNHARGRVLNEGLEEVTKKLAKLLDGGTIQNLGHRAVLQAALGDGLQRLGERETGTERIEKAVAAYRASLEEDTRGHVPLQWARTQNNLGNVLQALFARSGDLKVLEQAVAAYRAALEEFTHERVPLDWARTQNNLGNALRAMYETKADLEVMEQAMAAYRAALEEFTRENLPLEWATVQSNLGNGFQALFERKGDLKVLEQAVAAFRAALEERTREPVPLDWARRRAIWATPFALWASGQTI